MKGLAEVLAEHGPHLGAGGNVWHAYCLGCAWRGNGRGTMEHAANAYHAHVEPAVLDWLRERLAGAREDAIVPICEAVDPNWNKGAAILERLSLDRAERVADVALAAVAEALGVGEVRG